MCFNNNSSSSWLCRLYNSSNSSGNSGWWWCMLLNSSNSWLCICYNSTSSSSRSWWGSLCAIFLLIISTNAMIYEILMHHVFHQLILLNQSLVLHLLMNQVLILVQYYDYYQFIAWGDDNDGD
eukprot:303930_1